MKLITILLLLVTQFSIAQKTLDDAGFSEIRLGKSYASIENRLTVVDVLEIPEYAWFAPMSLEYWLEDVREDTASYYKMLETDRLVAESLNLRIIWCTFNNKQDANFFNYPIECAQLIFENDILKGIIVVFDKDDMTVSAKKFVFSQFGSTFGAPNVDNAENLLSEFEASWNNSGKLIRVSDALTMNEGVGESINILFWQE